MNLRSENECWSIPADDMEASALTEEGMLQLEADFSQVKIVKYIQDMEVPELLSDLKRISEYKMEINDYLDILAVWYRDVLLFKATRDADSMVFSQELISIREKARNSSYEGLECIIKALEKAKIRLNANVNFDMALELLLLTMKEN